MRILGLEVSVRKATNAIVPSSSNLYDRGWWPVVREPFAGAWQRNMPLVMENPLQHATLYRCVTMIANDIAKMRVKLLEQVNTTWQETTSAAFKVLTKPNRYQTRIQFYEKWLISKLRTGNTYVLLERDNRNVVKAMYILSPHKVKPLKASDGSIFYELDTNELAGIPDNRIVVPSDEIIHDRMNCLFDEDLIGVSPLYCTSAPAARGLSIEQFSAQFFGNAARPSGLLTAPGNIPQADAERLKSYWQEEFAKSNQGRIAVLGSGLKFEAMQQNAVDSQLIEQLKHNEETIATAFGIPAFMVGAKDPPALNNAELLDLQYYKLCLQSHIENLELLLSEGLGLVDAGYRAEFDLTGLFRMDSQTQITVLSVAVDKGIMTHNEARKFLNLPPEPGGDKLMAQQQMFTLEALVDRANAPALPATPAPAATPSAQPLDQTRLLAAIRRNLDHATAV
jgi:HK97 family phage portal protein